MRNPRDFRPGHLYGVTQKGNNGQWVHIEDPDFSKAIQLMRKCAARYEVRVHGWCLLHNHGHWLFEAFDKESISNVMRDMQSQYSRYLNLRYTSRPWVFFGKRGGKPRGMTRYLKAGPVNWTPRFDSEELVGAAFPAFLRYLELNPVRAKLCKRAENWPWSSALAHLTGVDDGGLLCLRKWRDLFGAPEKIAADWREYLEAPIVEEKANLMRVRAWAGSAHNRPTGWVPPVASASAGAMPG